MRTDHSSEFPGWTVEEILNEKGDIDARGKILLSYLDDVQSYYERSKGNPKFIHEQIAHQRGGPPGRETHTVYQGSKMSASHRYFLVTPKPPENELGEVCP